MNGSGAAHQQAGATNVSVAGSAAEGQPLVTITPPAIRLTGAQIWTAILAIPATVALLTSQGWIYKPARDSELTAVVTIVQSLQQAHEKSNETIKRLTEAVDNLSGIVSRMPKPKNLTGALKMR